MANRLNHVPPDGPRDITVRRIPFDFPEDIDPVWNPARREWSHMINGASLTMPYLEPFLIDTIRDALPHIKDTALRRDAAAFVAQEGQHYRQHRRYNELLKAGGYPELAAVEEAMARSYDRLRKASLARRLAYTAGFESMTLGVTRWLVERRWQLFGHADTRVASFILWHMVEETEHKRVAWSVYQAVTPGYICRAIGIFHGSLHVMVWARAAYIAMLKKDGVWRRIPSRLALWAMVGRFFLHVGPVLLRSALPGHTPEREVDPQWVMDWMAHYAESEGGIPLVDTDDPVMPAPTPGVYRQSAHV